MQLAVINLSPNVSVADAEAMTGAVIHQIQHDVAPAWSLGAIDLVLFHDLSCVPAGAMQIVITDDADRLGAYGYHDTTPDGQPYGRVFAQESLAMGGTALEGANGISTTLSHEVIEAVVDPGLDQWRPGPTGDFALEICDAVESQTYTIDVDGRPVSVSNFVLPGYFVAGATSGLDYLGRLENAFAVAPEGYAAIRAADGTVSRFPAGTLVRGSKSHPAARSFRRGLR